MGRDDEIVEFPLRDGSCLRLTRREWNEVMAEVLGTNTGLLPGGARHG